jgi:peroxiredoxin (alkyl hydroperoxide reductase subunit C)
MSIGFADDEVELQPIAADTIEAGAISQEASLYVALPQLVHLALAVPETASAPNAVVVVTIRNAEDATVHRMVARAGETRTAGSVLLKPGEYHVQTVLISPTELTTFSDRYEDFEGIGAAVIGVSTDSVHSHRAWLKTARDKGGVEGLRYPLASDITKSVARDYGVLIEDKGVALRGLFVIDPEGTLRYAVVHDLNVGRSADETLRVIQALQTGGLCQADWRPGQETLKVG